jgi:hypothetical protein
LPPNLKYLIVAHRAHLSDVSNVRQFAARVKTIVRNVPRGAAACSIAARKQYGHLRSPSAPQAPAAWVFILAG